MAGESKQATYARALPLQPVDAVLTRELQASSDLWPDLFAKPAIQKQRADVLSKMRVVRPVVETG